MQYNNLNHDHPDDEDNHKPLYVLQTPYPINTLKHFDHIPYHLISSGSPYLRLWQFEQTTGAIHLLKTWQNRRGNIRKMALSKSYILYTVSTRDDALRSWDLQGREIGHSYEGHSKPLSYVTLDDRDIIITASFDKTLKIWDSRTKDCQLTFRGTHEDYITKIKILPEQLVLSSADGTLSIWDNRKLSVPSAVLRGHHSSVLGFKTKKNFIYSFSNDGKIFIWNTRGDGSAQLPQKIEQKRVDVGYPISRLKIHKKSMLVYGTNSTIDIYSTNGRKLNTFNGHTEQVTSAFFYNSQYLFSASVDRTVRMFNVNEGPRTLYTGHTDTIHSIIPWNKWLYSASTDGSIIQWNNTLYSSLQSSSDSNEEGDI